MENFIYTFLLLQTTVSGQQLAGNSISDFVGQFTSLINQNGGIASLVNVIQQAANRYPSSQDPANPGIAPAYIGVPYPYEQPNRPYPIGTPARPSPIGSNPYYPNPAGQLAPSTPTGPGFMAALASISRHDDLKCVPRLLCELTSGGKPGYIGTQQSVVPLTNKDSLITLLTVLNFIDESPLLVFGRAALLGYTARGNSKACLTAYPTCPRDPDQLVHYLNNYNGGFFRFFSGQPSPHQQHDHQNRYAGKYPFEYTDGNAEERIQNRPYPVYSQAYQLSEHQVLKDSYRRPIVSQTGKIVFPERNVKHLYFPGSSIAVGARPGGFFPDRTGTGNLVLDKHENKVYYAPTANNVISFHDQRSLKFPVNNPEMHFPEGVY